MSVAAIDLGTNSLRLLTIVDGQPVRRENRIVRLGEGVDASRRILPAALDRVRAVLHEYENLLRADGVTAVRMVATSAARSASNPDDLRAVVRDVLGVDLDIIDGAEEARLSFLGATHSLSERDVLAAGDSLVVDLGGGSTEFVRGGATVTHARSVDIGSVRLTERLMATDPPSQADQEVVGRVIDAALDDAFREVPLAGIGNIIGVAGTVTTLTALALELREYDPAQIDGAVLPIPLTLQVASRLIGMSTAEREALGIPAGRADVIAAGALIWSRTLARVSADTGLSASITSEADILDGVAQSLVES